MENLFGVPDGEAMPFFIKYILNRWNVSLLGLEGKWMKNELDVLMNLHKNRNAKQREIAKATGLSLGNINIIISNLYYLVVTT